MSSRRLLLLALAAGVVLVLLGVRSLLEPKLTEEERLLALVRQLSQGAEQRDAKLLRQHVSARYRDGHGRDREQIGELLSLYFLRPGIITVYVVRSSVERLDEATRPMTARISATALLTRGPRVEKLADLLPQAARALRFEVDLEQEADGWRATSASWRDAGSVRDYIR